ncbi:MAG: cell division protein SepF [Candidatus Wallbacteria bacterium]|nr:cell division protein SepF [Candidatus Wallbacteria bacterium]
MNKFLKKVWDFFTFEDYEEDEQEEPAENKPAPPKLKLEVSVLAIANYDEVVKITTRLKEQQGVIADLSRLTSDERKRAIDFVCGTIYALNGNLQKLSENTFFFAPSFVSFKVERGKPEEEIFGKD